MDIFGDGGNVIGDPKLMGMISPSATQALGRGVFATQRLGQRLSGQMQPTQPTYGSTQGLTDQERASATVTAMKNMAMSQGAAAQQVGLNVQSVPQVASPTAQQKTQASAALAAQLNSPEQKLKRQLELQKRYTQVAGLPGFARTKAAFETQLRPPPSIAMQTARVDQMYEQKNNRDHR